MALSPATVRQTIIAAIDHASAETPRPLPYRTRRRRAGVYRICIALAGLAGFALAAYL